MKLSFFFQIQMTTDSLLTIVITPPPNSTEALTEWHRTGERQFIISVNDSWSIWALADCEIPGQLSYSFNITPLPTPDCQPLIQRSVCDEYYQTIAMPNRFGLTDQNFVYTYFEFGLQYVAGGIMCHLHLKFFFCLYAYPNCTEKNTSGNIRQATIAMPCRQFCGEVNEACAHEFVQAGGYLVMLFPKCALLPDLNEQPDCVFPTVDCGPPPQSISGVWSYNSTTLHSKANLDCPTGFTVRGTGEIKCEASGQWTQNEAKCIVLDDNTWLYTGIAVASMVVVLLIVALPMVYKWRYEINVLLYNRFRFRFRKQKENEGKQYDAFISYNVKVHIPNQCLVK